MSDCCSSCSSGIGDDDAFLVRAIADYDAGIGGGAHLGVPDKDGLKASYWVEIIYFNISNLILLKVFSTHFSIRDLQEIYIL